MLRRASLSVPAINPNCTSPEVAPNVHANANLLAPRREN